MTDTTSNQDLQKAQATPLDQAQTYLYYSLGVLKKRAKPEGIYVQIQVAIYDYDREVKQAIRNLEDELAASRRHAKGLKSHNDDLIESRGTYSDAYEHQKTLTRNALIEGREISDQRYALEDELRQLKQQAGDQLGAQDIIDRLRKLIENLDGQLYVQDRAIIRMGAEKLEADKHLKEAYSDVRSAESYSDRQTETANAYRIERDSLRSELSARDETIRHLRVTKEGLEGSVQRLMDLNGQLREATGIAGDHVRGYNDDVGVLYKTLRDSQAQLEQYLIGSVSERETLGRLLGILDNSIIFDAMHGELRRYAATEASDK